MRPNEGRLQTAEHILLRILKDRCGVKAGLSRFKEDDGFLEVMTEKDLRHLDAATLSREVNRVIQLNLDVKRVMLSREDAKKITDLMKVPESVAQVTVIDIYNFDKSPCADEHVHNTAEIGGFELTGIKRVGQDRYRFSFKVF
jgi:Ser-tRNA(Ala) deacylase AlaX